jgi:hypothetical protein
MGEPKFHVAVPIDISRCRKEANALVSLTTGISALECILTPGAAFCSKVSFTTAWPTTLDRNSTFSPVTVSMKEIKSGLRPNEHA